jgi:hypothetical protein
MDLILLDWTRMGRAYCLAGVVVEGNFVRTVRPLLLALRDAPVRNVGWPREFMDGHQRWEVFELVGPQPADPEPPHLEDTWVRTMLPRGYSVPPEQRRAILRGLAAKPAEVLFGTPLLTTRASAYLQPGSGQRSLATLIVPSVQVAFSASQRQGTPEADVRVSIGVLPLANRPLPLKDHHLLLRAEQEAEHLSGLAQSLTRMVRAMGPQVAIRLGVSRPFQANAQRGPGLCWLMVDGIFSLSDPQS